MFMFSGYGDFAKLPRILTKTVISGFVSKVKLRALKEAGLTTDPALPTRLPVLIFSHGLAGNQTTYSTYCGNLASRGEDHITG
jgi:platelet-activating factor acetylhydrolase